MEIAPPDQRSFADDYRVSQSTTATTAASFAKWSGKKEPRNRVAPGFSRRPDPLGEIFQIIDAVKRERPILADWSFGGWTAMML